MSCMNRPQVLVDVDLSGRQPLAPADLMCYRTAPAMPRDLFSSEPDMFSSGTRSVLRKDRSIQRDERHKDLPKSSAEGNAASRYNNADDENISPTVSPSDAGRTSFDEETLFRSWGLITNKRRLKL